MIHNNNAQWKCNCGAFDDVDFGILVAQTTNIKLHFSSKVNCSPTRVATKIFEGIDTLWQALPHQGKISPIQCLSAKDSYQVTQDTLPSLASPPP